MLDISYVVNSQARLDATTDSRDSDKYEKLEVVTRQLVKRQERELMKQRKTKNLKTLRSNEGPKWL